MYTCLHNVWRRLHSNEEHRNWIYGLSIAIRRLAAHIVEPVHTQQPTPELPVVGTAVSDRLLINISTDLWRMRQKMFDSANNQPYMEMRRVYRHLESIWDSLIDGGVEIMDHTGMPYDSGLALKVLAFQPIPNVDHEFVIETIKPTIYLNGQSIQMGEVIVGTPESAAQPVQVVVQLSTMVDKALDRDLGTNTATEDELPNLDEDNCATGLIYQGTNQTDLIEQGGIDNEQVNS